MKNIKSIAFALMTIFASSVILPQVVNAAPSETSVSKKKIKKKKTVKKKTKSKKVQVSSLNNIDAERALCFQNAGQSSAAYFACDSMKSVNTNFNIQNEQFAKKTTTVTSIFKTNSNIIREASKMEGLHERSNRVVLKTYMNVDKNGPIDPVKIPWCAGFANAVLNRAGFSGTESLMARSFLQYGQKTYKPVEGDIVVLKRGRSSRTGHVGFFNGYEWQGSQLYVKVLGGNQNKAVTVAYFPTNLVISYRRPV